MYRLFKDSPARHSGHANMCNSNKFPFKFCSTRRLENVSVAERDLEVFNDIKKLFENSKLQKQSPVRQ